VLDVNVDDDITINTANATGEITITSASTAAAAISLQAVTGAAGIDINGGTGGIDIDTVSTGPINIGNTIAGTGAINIGTAAAARTVTIGNVTGATAVNINSGTGSIALASTGAGDITINSDDTLLLDSDGVLELNSSAGAISIANDAVALTVNVGTGAAAMTTTIGSTNTTSTTVIDGGTGNVTLNAHRRASQTVTNGALVLTAADSGDTIFMDSSGGAVAAVLPAPKAGLFFKFIWAVAGTNSTITTNGATQNVIFGLTVARDGNAGVAAAGVDIVNFITASAVVGDFVELVSDGTNWYLYGVTDLPAAITMP
jgi:hypothetical protein